MSVSPYWIKRSVLSSALSSLKTHLGSAGLFSVTSEYAPLFVLSTLDEPDLAANISAEFYSYYELKGRILRIDNNAPNTNSPSPDTLTVSENGMLNLNWSESNGELLYPSLLEGEGTPKSFGLWITTSFGPHKYGASYNYQHKPDFSGDPITIWLTGTVGAYQSGADLEFEELANWKLGQSLYIADNKLELPLRLLR